MAGPRTAEAVRRKRAALSHAAHAAAPAAAFRAGAQSRRHALHDRYIGYLCFILVGYATVGKGFAYLGVPPLFVGEIAFVLGLLVLARSGCALATLGSLPSVALLALMAWVGVRTVPYLGEYGFEAARDSVIAGYGVFAFIVMALVLERPERLTRAVAAYSRFAWFYGFACILIVYTGPSVSTLLPDWPNSGVPLFHVRLGEGATHLAGVAVFALIGLRRVSRLWIVVVVCSACMVSVSRGAMLACLLPIAAAGLLVRRKARFAAALLAAALVFLAAYAVDLDVPLPGGRSIGPRQMINGFESIIGTSAEANFDGTKRWRLNWWDSIIGYTFNGPYFWTGKGFGVNLAVADGFVVGQELGGPPVRSPHNAHMTMLARAGVPGLLLWIATCTTWFATVLRAMLVARRRGDTAWSDLFLWIACYGLAFVVNASFDVALEGPMLGIWFWSLFGFGVAATMVYDAAARFTSSGFAPADASRPRWRAGAPPAR